MRRYISSQDIPKIEPIVIEELEKCSGKDCIKQVANKLSINQDLVRRIYNSRKVGQMKKSEEKENNFVEIETKEEIVVPDTKSTNILADELTNKTEAEKVIRKKNEPISDDVKILLLYDYESGNFTYKTLAQKYDISPASVYNILNELGGIKLRRKPAKSKTINNHQLKKQRAELQKKAEKELEKLQKEEIEEGIKEYEESKKNEKPNIIPDIVPITSEKEPENEKEHKKKIIIKLDDILKTIFSTSFKIEKITEISKKVGLCADRHEMGVDEFIYPTLTQEEMFDYPGLYYKACSFIEKMDKPVLHLYCTGCQCALASVVKACFDKKISLSLFHYNSSENTYMRQDMWKFNSNYVDDFTASIYDLLRKGSVYKFGMEINPDEFYVISINRVKENNDGFVNQGFVICDSYTNCFLLYADYVKDIQLDNNIKKSIYITKCSIENGKFVWGQNISKSYNFK